MKVYDCFLFHDEFEMLHARRLELEGLVDRHVLCEADRTHQGAEKSYALAAVRPWPIGPPGADVMVVHAHLPEVAEPMERERLQREAMWPIVERAAPDDLVILSDVDEIPSRSAVERAIADGGRCVCEQKFYCNAIDWLHPNPWHGTAMAPRRLLTNMTMLRWRGDLPTTVLPDGGWHFSWCGGPAKMQQKLVSFSHDDRTEDWYDRTEWCWREGVAVDNVKLTPVDIDDTYPIAMQRGDLDHLRRP